MVYTLSESYMYYQVYTQIDTSGVMKMIIINMLTAMYFQEDRKRAYKWVTEYKRRVSTSKWQ